jgi:hypothetical protein
MYETIHVFTTHFPEVADLLRLAEGSSLALAPFVLLSVFAGLVGFARRTDERSPRFFGDRGFRSPAPPARASTPSRRSSSAWISRTDGPIRL